MKKQIVFIMISALFILSSFSGVNAAKKEDNLIQMAILLDTSGSMDGLIEQAKSQLWKIVNELALAKKNGESPDMEVALYEYGKDSIPAGEGYLRMLVPLSTDLDKISEELFKLRTNGGSEYCGHVIQSATRGLKWSNNNNHLKVIVIAGNEPFTQGKIPYKDACKEAISKSIIVNTIFCGNYDLGIKTNWKDGADLADGKYMNIDQNQRIVHVDAPQDEEILNLGKKINETYIGYGKAGSAKKARQAEQDSMASSMAKGVMVQRAFTKSSKQYKNMSWDLVDAEEEGEVNIAELKEEDLPDEMKKMTVDERKGYIAEKKTERKKIQKQINKLNKERRVYVEKERTKLAESNTLDQALIKALQSQAKGKNFKFE